MINWYIKLEDGRTEGPFSESQIKYGIDSGKITQRMRIRQQQSRWASPEQVRSLFEELTERGFFLKDETGATYGPFTKERVLEFEKAKQLPVRYWIRRGSNDAWTEINDTPEMKRRIDGQAKQRQPRFPVGIAVNATRPANSSMSKATSSRSEITKPAKPSGVRSYSSRDELIKEIATIPGAANQQRPSVPRAPVMKLRNNTMVDRIIDLSERVESVFFGNPLTN